MTIFNELDLGGKYSKKDLASILGEQSLVVIREGVFSCKKTDFISMTFLRVTIFIGIHKLLNILIVQKFKMLLKAKLRHIYL
jgi:hypothetical protein